MNLASLHLITILSALLALPGAAQTESSSSPPRNRITINDGWRFAPGPIEDASHPAFPDTSWLAVNLPHTWNAADAFDKEAGYRRGAGWYRRRLREAANLDGRVYLHFEGANQVSDVYVNGELIDRHVGGYTAFTVDISDHLRRDGKDLIAVRVDNSHHDDVPPLNADFTFYGGIYRDVWLVTTNDVHFDMLDHGGPGLRVDTPDISERSATVRITGAVTNDSERTRSLTVAADILDPDGQLVVAIAQQVEIPSGESEPFVLSTDKITNPRLWSPESPNLYSVRAQVVENGELVDVVRAPLGFRWFSVDGVSGFSLNGKPIRLYGTNRHQDYPDLGNAVPDDLHRKDVRIIKENGFNFLRLAHYPQDPAILEEADRLGLIVWVEIPIVNLITMTDQFAENSERMLVEMIRQNYNHPSVAMWGYMNEVMLREPRPVPEGYYETLLRLAQRLEERVKMEDDSRLTAMAQSFHEVYNGKGLSDLTDILGMNLYFGWYYEDFEAFGAFLDSLHAVYPERPLLVSEYGAGSDERVHTLDARAFDFSSEHAQAYHRASFAQIQDRPYLAGSAVWIQFDFGSAGRQDTKNAINQKGLYFFDRSPKDIAYYYRAMLWPEPVLHLEREWLRRAGSSEHDSVHAIRVYSNLESVELFVNGRSAGTERIIDGTALWRVELRDGHNEIQASGKKGGAEIDDSIAIDYQDRRSMFGSRTPVGSEIAINAGSHYEYVDLDGVVWEADKQYDGRGWGYVGGRPNLIHHRIFGSDDDPLFQSARVGPELYRFDVSAGLYEVEVVVAEPAHDAPAKRTFSLLANTSPLFDSIDLAATHERYRSVRRKGMIRVQGTEGIRLRFAAETGEALVSGVRVRRAR